jgi:hypothetical protein
MGGRVLRMGRVASVVRVSRPGPRLADGRVVAPGPWVARMPRVTRMADYVNRFTILSNLV